MTEVVPQSTQQSTSTALFRRARERKRRRTSALGGLPFSTKPPENKSRARRTSPSCPRWQRTRDNEEEERGSGEITSEGWLRYVPKQVRGVEFDREEEFVASAPEMRSQTEGWPMGDVLLHCSGL